MTDVPHISLSKLRNMWRWAKANYYIFGEHGSVSATFRHCVGEEVTELTIVALRARVAELEAQVAMPSAVYSTLNYALRELAIMDGDTPRTLAAKAWLRGRIVNGVARARVTDVS